MGYQEVSTLLEPLYDDIKQQPKFWERKPLLAHYTSLATLERIISTKRIWFSNPLLMNDHEEVRFGVLNGTESVRSSKEISAALETDERRNRFYFYINYIFNNFDEKLLLDTYVFCTSEHLEQNTDGLLSMWRGYGADGNGAAIIFDTSKLGDPQQEPLLILAPVVYADRTDRLKWIQNLVSKFAELIAQSNVSDDDLYSSAHILMHRIKLFALFSKHSGFREEQEWRAVYLPEEDKHKRFNRFFGYHTSPRGVEPKLQLPITPIEGLFGPETTLSNLIHSIILGPTSSMPLARMSIERMLELAGETELSKKLKTSSIPYRPTTR